MQLWKINSRLILLVVVVVLLGLVALSFSVPQTSAGLQTQQTFDLSWNAAANGGATMSSASYTLFSTSGQPVAGELSGNNYTLIAGYWADLRTFISKIFFPAIRST